MTEHRAGGRPMLVSISVHGEGAELPTPDAATELLGATLGELLAAGMTVIDLRGPRGGGVLIEAEPIERDDAGDLNAW